MMKEMPESGFDKEKCLQCGLCADVCPNAVIGKRDGGMALIAEKRHLCFQCGQCMAVCPTCSVQVSGLSYDRDFYALPNQESQEEGFLNLIATRRAVRNFKDQPVPRELLEKIIKAISLAPPGFPPLKTEITVVQDPAVIKKALPHMTALYGLLVRMMKTPARFFIRKELGRKKFRQLENHLIPMMQSRLPGLKAGTEDTITRNAPAMILFHGPKEGEDIREDTVIAATYAMLAAHSIGLGGSIMDIIPPAINKKKELRALFQIPDSHEVLSSVILGFPKHRYRRGILRTPKSVAWIEG